MTDAREVKGEGAVRLNSVQRSLESGFIMPWHRSTEASRFAAVLTRFHSGSIFFYQLVEQGEIQ